MPKYPIKLLPIRPIIEMRMACWGFSLDRKDGKESVVIREAILKRKA
jgi:hypothetical protein